MRHILFAACTAVSSFLFNCSFAQQTAPPDPNPVVVTTWIFSGPQFGDTTLRGVNRDSLIMYYVDKGIRPNNIVKNFRILFHYWGDDSYKILFIYEIDGLGNMNKAGDKTEELINASFKTEAERNLFWRRWNRIFSRHEDNIMSDGVKPKM